MINTSTVLREKLRLPDYSNDDENIEMIQLTLCVSTILSNNYSEIDFETMHRKVYKCVLVRQTDKLYDRLRLCVTSHLNVNVKYKLESVKGQAYLEMVCNVWSDFIGAVSKIGDVFWYLDVIMLRRNKGVDRVVDMAVKLFRNFLLRNESLRSQLIEEIFSSIESERYGVASQVARKCGQILLEINKDNRLLYNVYFEDNYLAEVEHHCQKIKCPPSVTHYVQMVEAAIELETDRALAFGDNITYTRVVQLMVAELIGKRVQFIIESPAGMWQMMKDGNVHQLTKVHRLLVRIESYPAIVVDAINRYTILNYCNKATSQNFFNNILEFRDTMSKYLETAFDNEPIIEQAINLNFEKLLRLNTRTPQELSLYVQQLMSSVEDCAVLLKQAITVFRYMEKKDKFETHYRQHLAKRLLLNRIVNERREKKFIYELSSECGIHYTHKLQCLFKDMETSVELATHFSRKNAYKVNAIEFNVRVLTWGIWPLSANGLECCLPRPIRTLFKNFQTFYLSLHGGGRKLTLIPQLGSVEVIATLGGTEYTMVMSTFHVTVLYLFNTFSKLTYDTIQTMTMIPEPDFRRVIVSLMAAKNRILVKEPRTKTLESDHVFRLNSNYKSTLTVIKLYASSGSTVAKTEMRVGDKLKCETAYKR
ncbi:cullin-3-like [Adelges cooleyi]|uniref:cullin-3-like n=1 Tax=Adelges cooleyi TaxID=133065 RepID=UPI0021804E2E|nr:cullin-3-like [Adelges cooleyi]